MTSCLFPPPGLRLGTALALAAWIVSSRPALALQPVTEFLVHAKTSNPQNRAAHATTAQRDAEVGISTGNLLPNFAATGIYTRNQYEVTTAALLGGATPSMGASIPNIVIQPQDQLDANLLLTVPLINVANWDRRAAAESTLAGAQADEANSELTVQKSVIRDYYTLLGDEAVLLSATKNLEVARHNVKLARDRKESGTSSELDVQRALADQAKAEQNVTAAGLAVTNTRRDLYTLSGLAPEPVSSFPEDDLHEEDDLANWTGKTSKAPSVKTAEASRVTAEEGVRTVKASLLPTLSASAQERHGLRRWTQRHLPVPGDRLVEDRHDPRRPDARPERSRRRRTGERGARASGRRGRGLPRLAADSRRHRLGPFGARAGHRSGAGGLARARSLRERRRHAARRLAGSSGRLFRGRGPHPGRC